MNNKLLELNGLTAKDLLPQPLAEEAYLKAEYNSILLEMLMED